MKLEEENQDVGEKNEEVEEEVEEVDEESEEDEEMESAPDTLEDAIMTLYGENATLDPALDGIFVEIQKMKDFMEYRLFKIKVYFENRGVPEVPGLDDMLNTMHTKDIITLGKQYFQVKRFVRTVLEAESG